jgi:selenide,water dikinase
LVLTKPLGTGVLFNACRSKKLAWRELEPILYQVATLNKRALVIALKFEVHACTDITGFGIVGHALEMARGSGVQIDLVYDALPLYPNALLMYEKGQTTRSNGENRKFAEGSFQSRRHLSRAEEELLFDPQTSGGLLLSVPASQTDALITELKKAAVPVASCIGEVVAIDRPCIRIL